MQINNTDLTIIKFPLMYQEKAKESSPQAQPHSSSPTLPEGRDTVSIGREKADILPSMPENKAGTAASAQQPSTETLAHKSPPLKKWTFLVYEASDNDLEKFMVQDINDMENVGSSNNMNIVLQMDRGENPSELSGGWKGTRRFKLDKNEDPFNIDSTVLQDLGQINMSDPKNLADFIEWGMKEYPAQHYMLLISDHGGGWAGAIEDDSHKGWMSLPNIRKGIETAKEKTGQKLDIVGFDACLMGQSEVAYELKDVANYMIASEESEGAGGWPYHNLLSKIVLDNFSNALMMKMDLEPDAVARFIVRTSAKDTENIPTISAIDLGKMKNVGEATKALTEAIINTDTPKSTLKTIVRNTQKFEGFKDHYDFCRRIVLSEEVKDEKLKEAAQKVMDEVYEAVMLEEHSPEYPDAQGLSINLPSFNTSMSKEYKETLFAQDTGWDKTIGYLSGRGRGRSSRA